MVFTEATKGLLNTHLQWSSDLIKLSGMLKINHDYKKLKNLHINKNQHQLILHSINRNNTSI
jgi:hypothetical protein